MAGPTKAHIPDFRRFARRFQRVANEVAWESVYEFADSERELFANKILFQDFEDFHVIFYPESQTNLSPRWLRRKELADADLRTMLATHHYLRSIGVYANRKAGKVRVGFHPAAKARNLEGETVNILLKDMARVHEFGSAKANIPARKHWRPHLRTMKDRAPKVRAHIKQSILAKLKGVG